MTPSNATASRGMWVLAADTGCGACAQSIWALRAPRYGALLRGQGVRFARSPRHADIVLVTGPLSQQASAPLRQLLADVPHPWALVAVGDCAIDGCVFRGSAALVAAPATALDVNVEIAGCPPAPTAILDAIVAAKELLAPPPARPARVDQAAAPETAIGASTPPASSATPASVPRRTQR